MNYCLDTSVAIDILRGNLGISDRVSKLGTEKVFITPITAAELYKGAFTSSKQESSIRLVDSFLSSLEIVGMDVQSCREFGRLYALLKSKGKIVEEFDMAIGAIAHSNGLVLATKNKKHFENMGIEFETW